MARGLQSKPLPEDTPSRPWRADGARGSLLPPTTYPQGEPRLSKLLRGIAAGYGAKKLGGGCISTIVVFLLLWWLLGNFGIFQ